MATSYYNPNQQNQTMGRNYEGTQSYYRSKGNPATMTQTPSFDGRQGGTQGPGQTTPQSKVGTGFGNPNVAGPAQDVTRGQMRGPAASAVKPQSGFNSAEWRGGNAGGPIAQFAQSMSNGAVETANPMDGLMKSINGQAAVPTASPTATAPVQETSSPVQDLVYSLRGEKPTSSALTQFVDPQPTTSTGSPYPTVTAAEHNRFRRPMGDVVSGVAPATGEDLLAAGTKPTDLTPAQLAEVFGSQPVTPRTNEGVDIPTVTASNAYQQQIDDLLAGIDTNYSNQEAHALSANEAVKQSAINDMLATMGAAGTGTSNAALMPGLSGVEGQFADKAANIVGDLQKQQTQDKLQELATLGQIADAEGNRDLKAQIENAANTLKEAQFAQDQETVDITTVQGIQDGFDQQLSNWKALTENSKIKDQADALISGARAELEQAIADGMTGAELQQYADQIMARLMQYLDDYT